jgi:hypothetical protein
MANPFQGLPYGKALTLNAEFGIGMYDPRIGQGCLPTMQEFFEQAASLGLISSSAGSWLTKGNAGTDYTTNFIGTTDDEPLTFRTNNVARLGFDENGGALSTTDVLNPSGSYSILQWSTDAINQKIYVSDVLVTSVKVTTGDVTTLTEDVGTGVYNETIVSLAEILLSASGTGISDIHVYPNGEIGIASTANTTINAITATGGVNGNVGIGTTSAGSKLTIAGDLYASFIDNSLLHTIEAQNADGDYSRILQGYGGMTFDVQNYTDGTQATLTMSGNVGIYARTNGGSHIAFQDFPGNGNVGIGTSTPSSLLTVDD